ncbi:hypothetical protein [Halochromatium salexigens]|uniref:Uncharacterized protein n=1 Tax=Halochromatium salexigens TaxID=49447 RepID=A0AAJ0UFP8_HALSE|nr:hypothetical protein [Halochromatium salexigens]MBK5929752.1 hypothetical protein [Halochromatium salexigens]
MLAIALPKDTEIELYKIAMRAGLTPDEVAQRAILDFIEEQQDSETAIKRLANPAQRWSQADLEQELDLDD